MNKESSNRFFTQIFWVELYLFEIVNIQFDRISIKLKAYLFSTSIYLRDAKAEKKQA